MHPFPNRSIPLSKCETCGNEYENAFVVLIGGKAHTFDSFECAIHRLAPTCEHCQCRIIGHGVETNGMIFCCAHCEEHFSAGCAATKS